MCRIASLFLLQRLKGRAVIKYFFFLQGKAPKEIHAIVKQMLGKRAPSYATVKNWVAGFKHGDFSTCDAAGPGRTETVTTLEIFCKNSVELKYSAELNTNVIYTLVTEGVEDLS
jgi:ABC-type dipeptide/oligopeptide/nickel transport system permease component